MGGYADIPASVRAAGPGLRKGLSYRLVAVTGADAVGFVQRLCSQDVKALAPGACSPVAFLNPKGKLIASGMALRNEAGILLEVERGLAGKLAALLEQFHFAERLEIEPRDGPECTALMGGPEVFELASMQPGTCGLSTYAAERHGMCRVHWHGEAPAVGRAWSEAQAEAFRICSGLLRTGIDADEDTLALEAGLDDHISLSKGCYTGQEIVARIHTYGHVNRRLCLLAMEVPVDAGTSLVDAAGEAVGRTTSSAPVDGGGAVALGYVKRDSTALRTATGSPATVIGW